MVLQSATMMRRLLSHGKPSIVNEVMQLYRFIVDKYSDKQINMSTGGTLVGYLIQLMMDMYNNELQQFKAVVTNDEGTILVMTMLRILTQIVVRAPMESSEEQLIIEAACVFGTAGVQSAQQVHLMWIDESISLLIAAMRVAPDRCVQLLPYHEILANCFQMASEDQEPGKFFILAQELIINKPD